MATDADFAWLVEHGPELFEKYPGKWIAVHDGAVIGTGETATEAAEQAREKAEDGQFILEAIDAEADVIYGGPLDSTTTISRRSEGASCL